MNETLLDRAYSNYNHAQMLVNLKTDDEFTMNLVGYLLQQAAELSLKHFLETNGINYPRTHRIEELLAIVPDGYQDNFEDVAYFAEVITAWESKTRYIKNYFLEEKTIRKIMPLIKRMLDIIKELDFAEPTGDFE